jgi:hypothetical protein
LGHLSWLIIRYLAVSVDSIEEGDERLWLATLCDYSTVSVSWLVVVLLSVNINKRLSSSASVSTTTRNTILLFISLLYRHGFQEDTSTSKREGLLAFRPQRIPARPIIVLARHSSFTFRARPCCSLTTSSSISQLAKPRRAPSTSGTFHEDILPVLGFRQQYGGIRAAKTSRHGRFAAGLSTKSEKHYSVGLYTRLDSWAVGGAKMYGNELHCCV